MPYTIYGHSDDCCEIDGLDEIGCFDDFVTIEIGDAFRGGVRVVMKCGAAEHDAGVWSAALSPLDEGVPIPWSVSVGAEKYTARVVVDCPADTPIKARRGRGEKFYPVPSDSYSEDR